MKPSRDIVAEYRSFAMSYLHHQDSSPAVTQDRRKADEPLLLRQLSGATGGTFDATAFRTTRFHATGGVTVSIPGLPAWHRRSRDLPATFPRPRRYAAARRDMEWQMIRILLIFRLIHGVQLAITVPGTAARLRVANLAPAIVVLVLVVAESSWFFAHLIGNRRRSSGATGDAPRHRPGRPLVYDLRAAQVELTTAVLILLSCAWALPAGIRLDAMAPVVALTTEQITGAAIGSAIGLPLRLLVGGTAAIVASYAFVVGLVSPRALGHADVLIGISGFVALAYLIRRGARFLLALAGELSDMGERLSEEEQRRMLTVELHNHLGNTFVMFERLDPADLPGVTRARSAVIVAAERLNTFVATGRFSEKVPLIAMLHRQVGEAELIGLQVELILASRLTEATDVVDVTQVNLLEEALRAILINVPRNAGVHEALLHAGLVAGADGTGNGPDIVELVVTDEGKGFPPEILRQGVSATRSLAGHAERLARWGGTLALESVPGCTQVTLRLPVSPSE
jgi:hypothetical protein